MEHALALDPGNGDASLGLAELQLATGDTARARELFQQAAERRPYDFRTRHSLALAALSAGLQPMGGPPLSPPVVSTVPSPTSNTRSTHAARGYPTPLDTALEQLRVAAVIGR